MKRMKRFAIAAVVMMALGGPAAAQDAVTLKTNVDCGEWLQARGSNQYHVEWHLLGFIDGIVLGALFDFWNWGGIPLNVDRVYYWMDNYCRDNPLSNTRVGAIRLFNEHTNNAFRDR